MGALRASSARWLNDPERNTYANLKLVQLDTAARLGLPVPRSLVTRKHSDLVEFAAALGDSSVIAKVISPGTPIVDLLSTQYMVFSQSLEPTKVSAESLHAAPVLFQELITKDVELRVTVVGESLFACEIDSQSVDEASVDWRRVDARDLPHRAVQLPAELAVKLQALVGGFGLRFAAIDLIRRPDGSFVFLELNPNGQWLWVQEQTGLPIADAIADELLRVR
jgi:glutathione synthase/RimK-type ligase-like ATP-grasp enzyme